MANFPNIPDSVSQAVAIGNAAITRGLIKPGWVYRVVANTNCWLQFESAAAVGAGMYIPANEEGYFLFGGADSQGTAVEVNVIRNTADGFISFTPIQPVPSL